jgi:hypothetical protein
VPSGATATAPTQDEDQAQDDENEDQEEPPQEEDNDQGEMPMIKKRKMIRVQDLHTQESIKWYNEITPWTPFSAIFIRG